MADEIAYRELKPGEVIQAGDEWQAKQGTGAWHEYHPSMYGLETLASSIARRPYNITAMSEEAFMQQKLIEAIKQELALTLGIAQHWEHVAEQMEAQRDEAQAELAQLQQSPPAADHFADADKMVETELERKAWELYLRFDLDESESFAYAEKFLAERDRRRALGGHDANSL